MWFNNNNKVWNLKGVYIRVARDLGWEDLKDSVGCWKGPTAENRLEV